MKAIIATNIRNVIGKDGKLPWHNSTDLKHFKKLTEGNTLLVGYNTSVNLPVLPGRRIVVDLKDDLIDTSNIDWCIGGKKTYEKYSHLFTEVHVSYINDDSFGDTKFPNLDKLNENCKIINYYFGF